MANCFSGYLSKLKHDFGQPVSYKLPLDELRIPLNQYIGQTIKLSHNGKKQCIECGRSIKKTYNQGYCFPCVRVLAACDMCIVKPELCHYDQGTCREPAWGEAHCMKTHVVYMANSSGLKVGITRELNVPGRWVDQGAIQAIPLLRVSTRFQSGLVEVLLKEWANDKTNWRNMLKGTTDPLDLDQKAQELLEKAEPKLTELMNRFPGEMEIVEDPKVWEIDYPVSKHPTKIVSLNFDKTPEIESRLTGIKGQYLILEAGVLNVRKFTAYHMDFEF